MVTYRNNRLALEDITAETWSRLNFPENREEGSLCAEALHVIHSAARGRLTDLDTQETKDINLHEEWGDHWMGTRAMCVWFGQVP